MVFTASEALALGTPLPPSALVGSGGAADFADGKAMGCPVTWKP